MIFSVPMEATWKNKYYFEGLGSMSGVSDTIVILPEKIIFVEFKSAKGRQSPEQKNFETNIKRLGYDYFICRSFDEFQNIIEKNID